MEKVESEIHPNFFDWVEFTTLPTQIYVHISNDNNLLLVSQILGARFYSEQILTLSVAAPYRVKPCVQQFSSRPFGRLLCQICYFESCHLCLWTDKRWSEKPKHSFVDGGIGGGGSILQILRDKPNTSHSLARWVDDCLCWLMIAIKVFVRDLWSVRELGGIVWGVNCIIDEGNYIGIVFFFWDRGKKGRRVQLRNSAIVGMRKSFAVSERHQDR